MAVLRLFVTCEMLVNMHELFGKYDFLWNQSARISLDELFAAYYECRRNKRNTINSLAFELDYESNIVQLCNEINTGRYSIGRSIAFIVDKPVKREIFAADFRDRIVHHLIIRKLNPLFEKEFIYDSYSCREGRGTLFGIDRLKGFIRKCSRNYKDDCYILKLDIRGFFMNIDKDILKEKLTIFIEEKYEGNDKDIILYLCNAVVSNNPARNCIIKGRKSDWNGLPDDKSLFRTPVNCGLPIGNLTSQIFANFYLNDFDHFIKHDLNIRYYGRYVDDFVIVHNDKSFLLNEAVPRIKEFLLEKLHLRLHPQKIFLQYYSKGVKFIGAVVLPNRIYIANRTKGNFYKSIREHNLLVSHRKPFDLEIRHFQASINSYLGIMKHCCSYRIRKNMLRRVVNGWWWNYLYVSGGYAKVVRKQKIIRRKF